jgi:cytochrome c553
MRRVTFLAVTAALAASVVVLSGVISIKASSGHWALTAALLDFTKRRSVATHALGVDVPPLDSPALVIKGAAHFETGCRPCHGSPAITLPAVPRRMTPHPPRLNERVTRWKPNELFYIVRHGIKFTGMPAWPAMKRDDEVWAVVAFLGALPSLSAEEYLDIVFGPTAPEPSAAGVRWPRAQTLVSNACARCHGMDGLGRGVPAFPRLAGQRAEYLKRALVAYARGMRQSGIMSPVAAALGDEDVRLVAEYYAGLTPGAAFPPTPAAERGASIATRGIPERDVPPCGECHGPAGSPKNAAYPRLTGQFAEYLMLQLRLFADGHRGGSSYEHLMRDVAWRLTEEERRDAAEYYASASAEASQ